MIFSLSRRRVSESSPLRFPPPANFKISQLMCAFHTTKHAQEASGLAGISDFPSPTHTAAMASNEASYSPPTPVIQVPVRALLRVVCDSSCSFRMRWRATEEPPCFPAPEPTTLAPLLAASCCVGDRSPCPTTCQVGGALRQYQKARTLLPIDNIS